MTFEEQREAALKEAAEYVELAEQILEGAIKRLHYAGKVEWADELETVRTKLLTYIKGIK